MPCSAYGGECDLLRHACKHVHCPSRKYESTMEAFRRNTGQEPPISYGVLESEGNLFANRTNRKRATGSVPLVDDQDVLWQGTISVGTPPVDYTVDFDTGHQETVHVTCEGLVGLASPWEVRNPSQKPE